MPDLRTRLIRLAHSEPSLRPHLLPLIASGDAATDSPELKFTVSWGGGTAVHLGLILGAEGDRFPKGSPAYEYASRELVAELRSINVKKILAHELHLPDISSVEGPEHPTLRDVFVGDWRTGDRRAVYVKYIIRGVSATDLLDRIGKARISDFARLMGIRY